MYTRSGVYSVGREHYKVYIMYGYSEYTYLTWILIITAYCNLISWVIELKKLNLYNSKLEKMDIAKNVSKVSLLHEAG